MVAISVDVIGIILVLIGALIVHAHSNSGLGLGLYWLGFVLLIVALIIFVLTMRKVSTQKTVT
jgi:drug/metabolite transporter (DMT)-like permease